ncbi:MAG: NAD-dependent epimerase/dehydratase, partial [Bdellovibrionales bacterium]|nr:NAD-dependent epimerase/dehydratase [Bdellovibrionales bacterium]
MRILVTGGAGYIGSTLVPLLLEAGHSVTVLDNFMYQQAPLLSSCHNDKLQIIRGDVRNESLITKLVSGSDAILPLACITGAPACDRDPITARQVNFEAIATIDKIRSSDQLMIYPCTNSGYGVGEDGLYCDEDSPLRPVSLYGDLKVRMEQALLEKGNCVTFRFATVFGASPRMRLDLLVNDFVYRAVTDRTVVLFESHFKRNFLHVRDASRVFLHALDNYATLKGQPYNVGLSDANLSKKELCELITAHVPQFKYVISEIGKDPDQRNYIVSNSRIEAT